MSNLSPEPLQPPVFPPNDASLNRQAKEMKWQAVSSELSQITDRLGMPIDTGIMETVVALSVHGLNTRQSCEGHLEHGTGAPWVDLEAKGVTELEDKQHEAFEKAHSAVDNRNSHISEEEIDKLYEEAHAARREVKAKHLEEARKAMTLLEDFYRDRKDIPFDRRLHLSILGNGRCRIESQGAEFQEVTEQETRQQKLTVYQEEMKAFTTFLRERFFSNSEASPQTGIPLPPNENPQAV